MSDPQIDVEVLTGVDQISIDYTSPIDNVDISTELNLSSLVVDIDNSVDQIYVTLNDEVSQIEVEDSSSNIQVIEIGTVFSAVGSVNGLSGDVVLTYVQSLTYVSPVGGVYTYTINHNLGYESPIIMVYNTDNESVMVDQDIIDNNTVEIRSLSNMNNFKVVVQR
jgi:hypothetical protein